MRRLFFIICACFFVFSLKAQNIENNPASNHGNNLNNWERSCLRRMNTVRPAVRPAQNTGSSVATMILNANWMKQT